MSVEIIPAIIVLMLLAIALVVLGAIKIDIDDSHRDPRLLSDQPDDETQEHKHR